MLYSVLTYLDQILTWSSRYKVFIFVQVYNSKYCMGRNFFLNLSSRCVDNLDYLCGHILTKVSISQTAIKNSVKFSRSTKSCGPIMKKYPLFLPD